MAATRGTAGRTHGGHRVDLPLRMVDLPDLHTAHTAQESVQLNEPQVPSIIISASGMATGGRVVHHLQHLPPPRATPWS